MLGGEEIGSVSKCVCVYVWFCNLIVCERLCAHVCVGERASEQESV